MATYTKSLTLPGRVKVFARGRNASVAAGVDAKLLRAGPVEAIMERIRLYIDQMARDGRCLIHLNHIPAETPPEHIFAAVAACHAYGRLPILSNLDQVSPVLPPLKSFREFLEQKGEPLEGL